MSDLFDSLAVSVTCYPEFNSNPCCSLNSGQNNMPVTCTNLTLCAQNGYN